MDKKQKVILLIGQKQVGKSFIAMKLQEHLTKHVPYWGIRFSLANPIKETIQRLFKAEFSQCYGTDAEKETQVPLARMTARKAMQLFGTEAMQPVFGKDVWCRLLNSRMAEEIQGDEDAIAIIDDCRFDHEVEYASKNWDPFFIEIFGQNSVTKMVDLHSSEHGITPDCREVYLQVAWDRDAYYQIVNDKSKLFEFPSELLTKLRTWQSS